MSTIITLLIAVLLLSFVKSQKKKIAEKIFSETDNEEAQEPSDLINDTPSRGYQPIEVEEIEELSVHAQNTSQKIEIKDFDFDAEKMIIYSEILKPKF